MANTYYRLIKLGKKTIDQVPAIIRAEVQSLIDADAGE